MKSLRFLAVVPFILIGCGDDTSTTDTDATTTTNPDTTTGCGTNVTPGTSALTGVNTNVTVTNPNPTNSGCTSAAITNTTGAKYPWGGATVSGRTYTCNACPFGFPQAQGAYRIHGYSMPDGSACASLEDPDCGEDYSEPPAGGSQFTETIWLDGNTFRIRQKNGSAIGDIELSGYYFCGMNPEGPNEHVVWAIVDAEPNTVTGLKAGDFLESTKLLGTADAMLTYWYEALNSGESDANAIGTYCKYGKTDTFGNTCSDPFGDTPCLE